MCRVYSVFDLTVREVAACLEVNLGDLSLFFSPLPCLASSFFSQIFILLNASMPYLRNTPVGELIQKQGANEYVSETARSSLRFIIIERQHRKQPARRLKPTCNIHARKFAY